MKDRTASSPFPTTRWTLVVAASKFNSETSREALADLCSLYWYPIFAFVRRRDHTTDEAQDLTQGFFTRLIEKGDLADADRTRGRFRTFLLTACQHFLANERDHAAALKRGGGHVPVSIDSAIAEGRYERSLSHAETPEHLYERQWCLTLLEAVLQDLRMEYFAAGKERVFERLKDFLTAEEDAGTHAKAASELGMTVAAVKVAVHRLRRRYREAMRRRVADTVESPIALSASALWSEWRRKAGPRRVCHTSELQLEACVPIDSLLHEQMSQKDTLLKACRRCTEG